jgi:alkaline phosphatase D
MNPKLINNLQCFYQIILILIYHILSYFMKNTFKLLFAGIFCFLFHTKVLLSQLSTIGLNQDSLHAPFIYGIASGQPQSNGFVIWTYVEDGNDSITVDWEIALDSTFNQMVASGNQVTYLQKSHVVKVKLHQLMAGTTYYYRFKFNQFISNWGRAKTWASNPTEAKLAVMSCSSLFSGYFNAYRRIAERNDLDFILHLGDFVYDYVDPQERVRVPNPTPTRPQNRLEWENRYKLYLMDPDLREMRRMQSSIQIWDNHDIPGGQMHEKDMFILWNPIEEDSMTSAYRLYREYEIGQLVSVITLDAESLRDIDSFPDGTFDILGHTQNQWLSQQICNTPRRWTLIANQKMFSGWYTRGINPALLTLVPNDGAVFDNSSWDGYLNNRNAILNSIQNCQLDNVVFLSGDAHASFYMDIPRDPFDSIQYQPETGMGSIATEFLAGSITRGNFDESGISPGLEGFVLSFLLPANPHHRAVDLFRHGYGIIEINSDSLTATTYYSEILQSSSTELQGISMTQLHGENHWKRTISNVQEPAKADLFGFYPNPSSSSIQINGSHYPFQIEIHNIVGQKLLSRQISEYDQNVNISHLDPGIYFISIPAQKKSAQKFIKIN